MPRANRKNHHHNNKKKKNARHSQGQTSTASGADYSVEVPRGDGAQNAAANDDVGSSFKILLESRGGESKHSNTKATSKCRDDRAPTGNVSEDRNVSLNESETLQKEKEKITQNKLNIGDEIEQQGFVLNSNPSMDLQHDKQTFDSHAEDDATCITRPSTIQREKKTWTSWMCCCGVFDLLRVMIKGHE